MKGFRLVCNNCGQEVMLTQGNGSWQIEGIETNIDAITSLAPDYKFLGFECELCENFIKDE